MSWPYLPYFTEDEMRCSCGCGRVNMHPDTMSRMVRFRKDWDKGIFITSGFRCLNHPEEKKKSEITTVHRPHYMDGRGRAFDSPIPPVDRHRYVELAIQHEWTGIGVYPWGIHLDDIPVGRFRPVVW